MGALINFRRFVGDGLQNMINGLGGTSDPLRNYEYQWTPLDRLQLEYAYRGDWLARRIVDAPAEDATRQWRDWQAENDQIEKLEEAERTLDLRRRLRRALSKARLYGGAAIVMGIANQGTSDQPIDVEKVGEGDLKFIVVFHQFELSPSQRIKDINSEWFGQPEYYTLATGTVENMDGTNGMAQGVRIHPSRVIPLVGNELPDDTLMASTGNIWGDSVLQVVDDALKSSGAVLGGIASLINDAKMDVIHIPNLTKQLADEEGAKNLIARMSKANALKSNIRTLLLDEKETWERVQTNFGAMPALVDSYIRISCGAACIPVTRVFGESSGGLGGGESGGQSDLRNYYDDISSMQKNELSPTLTVLDNVFIRSTLGDYDPNIFYEWAPLWQLSNTEKADIANKKATTTKLHVDMGLINPDAMRKATVNQLIEDQVFPGLESAIEEFGDTPPEPPAPTPEDINAHIGNMQKTAGQLNKLGAAANQNNPLAPKPAKKAVGDMLTDAEPRTLYVRRDVLNKASIAKWARSQGLDPMDDLHVTIAYSRNKLDWMKVRDDTWAGDEAKMVVPAGGPRIIDVYGEPADTVVLLFVSERLKWRHEAIVEAGASHDYPEYQPHVSISKQAGVDVKGINPYRGPIILGPEIFEEVKS